MLRRSQLYVPGNNERMVPKSTSIHADSVILDLEDAVPLTEKGKARALIKKLVTELDWGNRELCVRVNGLTTTYGKKDIEELGRLDSIDCFVVPKAESDLSKIHRDTGKSIIPIIETAKGLIDVRMVAESEGVVALSYGAADLAFSLGGLTSEYLENPYVKTLIVVTARYYGIDPIDNVFFDLNNPDEFRRQTERAKSLGFGGKQVIHPSQVDMANEIFSPTSEEVERAKMIVRAYERARSQGRGTLNLEGELVDEVHYRAAKATLGLATDS